MAFSVLLSLWVDIVDAAEKDYTINSILDIYQWVVLPNWNYLQKIGAGSETTDNLKNQVLSIFNRIKNMLMSTEKGKTIHAVETIHHDVAPQIAVILPGTVFLN